MYQKNFLTRTRCFWWSLYIIIYKYGLILKEFSNDQGLKNYKQEDKKVGFIGFSVNVPSNSSLEKS